MPTRHTKAFMANLEHRAFDNTNFCEVLFTGNQLQLALMSIQPGEETGLDIHPHNEQSVRIKSGRGKVIVDEEEFYVDGEYVVFVPAGARYNIINLSHADTLQLYVTHSPPYYAAGAVYATKLDTAKTPALKPAKKPLQGHV